MCRGMRSTCPIHETGSPSAQNRMEEGSRVGHDRNTDRSAYERDFLKHLPNIQTRRGMAVSCPVAVIVTC